MADPAPGPLEWLGWGALTVLTVAIAGLAILRPTDPDAILSEIRLAAGFDRYQAAMDEGHRLYSRATADFRMAGPSEDDRSVEYRMLADAERLFLTARAEADGHAEDVRAQRQLVAVYHAWAGALHADGTGPWYRRSDRETLERARDIAVRGLALRDITEDQRQRMQGLKTKIDRALTPWPIL